MLILNVVAILVMLDFYHCKPYICDRSDLVQPEIYIVDYKPPKSFKTAEQSQVVKNEYSNADGSEAVKKSDDTDNGSKKKDDTDNGSKKKDDTDNGSKKKDDTDNGSKKKDDTDNGSKKKDDTDDKSKNKSDPQKTTTKKTTTKKTTTKKTTTKKTTTKKPTTKKPTTKKPTTKKPTTKKPTTTVLPKPTEPRPVVNQHMKIMFHSTKQFAHIGNSRLLFENVIKPAAIEISKNTIIRKTFRPVKIPSDCSDNKYFYNPHSNQQYGCENNCVPNTCKGLFPHLEVDKKHKHSCYNYHKDDTDGPGENADLIIYLTQFGDHPACKKHDSFREFGKYCNVDPRTKRPIFGVLNFCETSYPADMEYMKHHILHQLLHIMAFDIELWGLYPSWTSKSKDALKFGYPPYDAENKMFSWNKKVMAPKEIVMASLDKSSKKNYMVYDNQNLKGRAKIHFNCTNIDYILMEDSRSHNQIDSHFDMTFFGNELMTKVFFDNAMLLSEFSFAYLEETGWYKMTYIRFKYEYLKDLGCGVETGGCLPYIKKYQDYVPMKDELPFCNVIEGRSMKCDERNKLIKICGLETHESDEGVEYFQYFNKFIGGKEKHYFGLFKENDYCPIYVPMEYGECNNAELENIDHTKIKNFPFINLYKKKSVCVTFQDDFKINQILLKNYGAGCFVPKCIKRDRAMHFQYQFSIVFNCKDKKKITTYVHNDKVGIICPDYDDACLNNNNDHSYFKKTFQFKVSFPLIMILGIFTFAAFLIY